MKIKKLSEYEAIEGLAVMGKLSRAVAPYAKNNALMDKLRACFAQADEDDTGLSGAMVFLDIIDIITNDAPELLLEIISVMSGEDKKKVAKFSLLKIVDALMELKEDEELTSFLSKRFSLVVLEQRSTSTITEGNV